MAIKLNKSESLFRNELIFAADAKAVNIDNTLVNLFMLLKYNGARPKLKVKRGRRSFVEIDNLKKVLKVLEERGIVKGYTENPEAAEMWVRSNLVNMVNRGKVDKENISSLRPIHLESFRFRNAKHTRDYNTADQIYLMLGANQVLKNELRDFLSEGWDAKTDQISSQELDVDSLGLLHIIKNVSPGFIESSSNLNQIEPILVKQSELYCDDIRRLLTYKRHVPRNVLIDYIRTISSFHLSLYIQKLIHFLPIMIEEGTTEVKDNWSIVLDVTDDYESKVSRLAVEDAETLINKLYDYIKSTFQINAVIRSYDWSSSNSENLEKALNKLKEKDTEFQSTFKAVWTWKKGELKDEEEKELAEEQVKYEDTFFDKYIESIMKQRGAYQYKFHIQHIDKLSQKNNERGFISQGRSKKHPRRFVLGTRLLECLVQILVLESDTNRFITKSLSIEELVKEIRDRYGLIINGLGEERFKNADLNTNLAFKENMEAFKLKLRQIGFYNDLSDAYILQKIRPRYEL